MTSAAKFTQRNQKNRKHLKLARNRPSKMQAHWHKTERVASKSASASQTSDDPTPGQILDAIKKRLTEKLSRSDAELYPDLQNITIEAFNINSNIKSWASFCRDPYWLNRKSKPKMKERGDALRFALKRSFPDDRREQKNASFYLRAITKLLGEGVKPQGIARELKARGLRQLAKELAADRRKELDDTTDPHSLSTINDKKAGSNPKFGNKEASLGKGRGDVVAKGTVTFKSGSRMEGVRIGHPVLISGVIRSVGPDFRAEFYSWELDTASK